MLPAVFWSLQEAAQALRCDEDTVSTMIRHHKLPAAKIGRAWVLIPEDVVAWVRTRYDRPDEKQPATPGDTTCASTSAASAASGGSTSPSKASRALSEALAPRTRRRRGSGPPTELLRELGAFPNLKHAQLAAELAAVARRNGDDLADDSVGWAIRRQALGLPADTPMPQVSAGRPLARA